MTPEELENRCLINCKYLVKLLTDPKPRIRINERSFQYCIDTIHLVFKHCHKLPRCQDVLVSTGDSPDDEVAEAFAMQLKDEVSKPTPEISWHLVLSYLVQILDRIRDPD